MKHFLLLILLLNGISPSICETKMKIKKRNNKNIKSYLAIIKQIETVRSKNNKNWMDLYRLAFAVAPDESVKIIKKILSRDKSVSKLAEKLIK